MGKEKFKGLEENVYFTKSEREGLGMMALFIISFIIFGVVIRRIYKPVTPYITIYEQSTIDSLNLLKKNNKNNNKFNRAAEGDERYPQDINEKFSKIPFYFDPNTLPIDSLLLLPISSRAAYNIKKYRESGAVFRKKEDLKKIYGLEEDYLKLEDYIQISQKENQHYKTQKSDKSNRVESQEEKADSKSRSTLQSQQSTKSEITEELEIRTITANNESPEVIDAIEGKRNIDSIVNKYRKKEWHPEPMELNEANEYQLQLISGIGEYYSNKIIKYRNNYGGYYKIDQLKDAGIPPETVEKVRPYLTCNPDKIKKRKLNKSRLDSLYYIPEIPRAKIKTAYYYTHNHYPVKGVEDLKKMLIFNDKDIEMLLRYWSFEY